MPKTKSFVSSPDEPVDWLPTSQPPKKKLDEPVEEKFEILTKYSLKNKESNKKK